MITWLRPLGFFELPAGAEGVRMLQTYRIIGLALIIVGAILCLLGSGIIGGTAISGTGWLVLGVIMVIGGLVLGRWVQAQLPQR